jgi:lipid-binding SYLF domain-containing protein
MGRILLALLLLPVACATPRGRDADAKRSFVDEQTKQTLESFYAARPELRRRVEASAGYAVFTNVNIKVLLLGTGHGYGLAVDRATGKQTYMRMLQLGAGPGLGVTDLRLLFVFKSKAAFEGFLTKGLEFGGRAEVAATAGDLGAAAETGANVGPRGASLGATGKTPAALPGAVGAGMEVYRITKSGVSLQAQVAGTRYWRDGSLN